MNKERRKQIDDAVAKLNEAMEALQQCQDDEREYFDNMPENMQQGEKGQAAENAIDELEEAVSSIDQAIASANGAMES